MKIYNEIISRFNETTQQWETVYEDSFEYDGPMALATTFCDCTHPSDCSGDLPANWYWACHTGNCQTPPNTELTGNCVMEFDDPSTCSSNSDCIGVGSGLVCTRNPAEGVHRCTAPLQPGERGCDTFHDCADCYDDSTDLSTINSNLCYGGANGSAPALAHTGQSADCVFQNDEFIQGDGQFYAGDHYYYNAGGGVCVQFTDCNGDLYGGAVIDQCGICGGLNATMDCEGTCGGSIVDDECGICGGDGSSCEDISGTNRYIELNQYQKIDTTDILPFSSLKVSFWMKTVTDDTTLGMPKVEAGVKVGNDPGRGSESYCEDEDYTDKETCEAGCTGEIPCSQFTQYLASNPASCDSSTDCKWTSGTSDGEDASGTCDTDQGTGHACSDWYPSCQTDGVGAGYCEVSGDSTWTSKNNEGYIDQQGYYNSIIGGTWNYFGGAGRFENSVLDKWEKMEYTFNLQTHHLSVGTDELKDLWFLIQWGYAGHGEVYLDNFSVTNGYDFIPDADVRMKKGENEYGTGLLTEYYDPNISDQLEKYNDTIAPLEASFYFYPRYNSNDVFDFDTPITHNDFRNGMYYIYDVDWGDGSPNEFISEPEKLGDDKMIYHTYETSGIYEVTGTMLRMKPDRDYNPLGIAFNQRFTLRININEGLDEDFRYFGSDGFSFIPYKNTLPVIGGYGKESIYYKSVKRQLGFISDDIKVDTQFEKPSDKLKTEVALQKMEDNLYRGYRQWNVDYYQQTGTHVSYNIGTISTLGSPTLSTTADWSHNNVGGHADYNGMFNDIEAVFGITHNLVSDGETIVEGYFDGMFIQEHSVGGTPNGNFSPANFTAHYSTWIYVEESFSIDAGFKSDNRGYFYINDVQIATDVYDAASTADPYTYNFIGGNWYKLDIILNEGVGGDYAQIGWNVNETTQITDGGLLNYEILPHFTLPRFENQDGTGNEVYTGTLYGGIKEELGDSIGDVDITNIRYFNEPKQMYEMLGLEDSMTTPTGEEFQKWKVDYYQHTESLTYTLDTLPTAGSPTLSTTADWSVYQVGSNATGRFDDVHLLFDDTSLMDMDESSPPKLFTVHYSTWIYVNESFTVDTGLTSDNNGYFYINEDEVASDIYDSSSTADPYTYNFIGGNWYKLDLVLNESGGGDYITMGWNINTTSEINAAAFQSQTSPGNPSSPRYWKNIIPEGTSYMDRNGITIDDNGIYDIDTNVEQTWISGHYYPVLPNYNKFGLFNYDYELDSYDYVNNNIPFPLEAPITNEELNDGSLKINITSNQIESNILDDLSGNQNHGFAFSDYRPNFDNQTLEPKKVKNTDRIRSSKNDGAF